MTIKDYTFGKIVIDEKDYTSDVIVYPDRVVPSWRREQGHLLMPEDLRSVIAEHPQILVVGTGYFGRMEVPTETIARLRDAGIQTLIARTKDAVADFERLQQNEVKVIAVLHLTC